MIIKRFRDTYPEHIFYNYLSYDVLQECYIGIDESELLNERMDRYNDSRYVNTAREYTRSMFLEPAVDYERRAREGVDEALAKLNGYILNEMHLISKYKSKILDKARSYEGKFICNTYENTKLYSYKTSLSGVDYDEMVKEFSDTIAKKTGSPNIHKSINDTADSIIHKFTDEYLGEAISAEKIESAYSIVRNDIQGEARFYTVNKASIPIVIQNLLRFNKIRSELKALRKEIPSIFAKLKESYNKNLDIAHSSGAKNLEKSIYNDLDALKNPQRLIMVARANAVMVVSDLDYNRIYTTIMRSYYESVRAKTDCLVRKIDENTAVATTILTALNLITALPDPANTKKKDVFIKR